MGGANALIAWIGISLAMGLLARFWQHRSFFLWAIATGVLYGLIEDPSFGPLRGGGRFLPIDQPLLGLLSSLGITALVVIVTMVVLPRREPRRRHSRSRSRHHGPLRAEEAKQCPSCVETIRASAEICPFCGHRFEAQQAPAAQKPG